MRIRLPGAVWAGLLIAVVALSHEYLENPIFYDVGYLLVSAALKYLEIESETTIGELLSPPGAERHSTPQPAPPNRLTRLLLG